MKNSNFELKKKNDSGPQRDLGFLKMYTQGYQSDVLKAKRRKLDKIFITAQGAIEEINMINTINFAATHESKQSAARAKLVFYPHSHWQVLRLGGHH